MGTMPVYGDDTLSRDHVRTLLYDRFGTGGTVESIGEFLHTAFGESERATFEEFLARLYRHHRGAATAMRDVREHEELQRRGRDGK